MTEASDVYNATLALSGKGEGGRLVDPSPSVVLGQYSQTRIDSLRYLQHGYTDQQEEKGVDDLPWRPKLLSGQRMTSGTTDTDCTLCAVRGRRSLLRRA